MSYTSRPRPRPEREGVEGVLRHRGAACEVLARLEAQARADPRRSKRELRALAPRFFEAIADERVLRQALDQLAREGGAAPGPDGLSYDDLGHDDTWELLRGLRDEIRDGTYRPGPVRRVAIPKGSGRGTRTLQLANVADRVVAKCAALVLGPFLDPRLDDRSFGGRPHRGRLDALAEAEAVSHAHRAWVWVVDDLVAAFDRVPRSRLQTLLQGLLPDRRLIELLGHLAGGPKGLGIPQGSPLSPLLLNLALDAWLDRPWRCRYPDRPMLRFVDDLVLPTPDEREAQRVREDLAGMLRPAGFQLKGSLDSAIARIDQGETASWLGFETSLGPDGGLHHAIGSAGWERLDERLEAVRHGPLAPLRAEELLKGWLASQGPACPVRERQSVVRRARLAAAARGFDDLPPEAEHLEIVARAWDRWTSLRAARLRRGRYEVSRVTGPRVIASAGASAAPPWHDQRSELRPLLDGRQQIEPPRKLTRTLDATIALPG